MIGNVDIYRIWERENRVNTFLHIFHTGPKSHLQKSIDLGRIENMNKNANTLQSLGILLSSKQLGRPGRFSSLIRVLSGHVSASLCGLGSKPRLTSLCSDQQGKLKAGYSQAPFPRLVLLVLTVLNKKGNLIVLGFLDIFLK